MTINLGMPATPPPVLAPRRPTRQIKVGKVLVGGDAPVSVQSMTTTKTTDINGTLQQIAELTATGCDIVRVAVPSQDDADVLYILSLIHIYPQSIVHSMVEFVDGSTIAQCSPPDMRLPIALGLAWPDRLPDAASPCDWTKATSWTCLLYTSRCV